MRRLDLAEDLGLADHHRVQPGGHPEEVLHRLLATEDPDVLAHRRLSLRVEVPAQPGDDRLRVRVVVDADVELGAVAGRDRGCAAQAAVPDQESEQVTCRWVGEGGALPDLHGSRAEGDPGGDEAHLFRV